MIYKKGDITLYRPFMKQEPIIVFLRGSYTGPSSVKLITNIFRI